MHDGAEGWLSLAEWGYGGECREVGLNGLSGEGCGREREEAVGGVVGEQDGAVGVGGEDGYGTAIDEDVQLLFGVAAGDDFVFDIGEMERGTLAAEDSFADVEAEAAEGEEVEEVAWDADLGVPDEAVEEFGEEGAGESDEDDVGAREDGSGERDGEEIEQRKRSFGGDSPVGDGDERGEEGCGGENSRTIFAEERKDHGALCPVGGALTRLRESVSRERLDYLKIEARYRVRVFGARGVPIT